MVNTCAILNCLSHKGDKTIKYSLFQLPKNDLQRASWLQFINTTNKKITNKPTHLCELHFTTDDVIRTYSFWNNYNDIEMVRNKTNI